MHPGFGQPIRALAGGRARFPRLVIGTSFLLALLFAAGIEALVSHHHDGVADNHQCAICRVAVHAPGDASETSSLLTTTLAASTGRPLFEVPIGPVIGHFLGSRLRAPPAA